MESTLTLEPVSPRERWTPIELMRDFNNVRHLVPKSPGYAPTIETPIGRRLMDRYLEDSISLSSYGVEYSQFKGDKSVHLKFHHRRKLVESLGNGPTSVQNYCNGHSNSFNIPPSFYLTIRYFKQNKNTKNNKIDTTKKFIHTFLLYLHINLT